MSNLIKVLNKETKKVYVARQIQMPMKVKIGNADKVIFPGDWMIESSVGETLFCREYLFDRLYDILT